MRITQFYASPAKPPKGEKTLICYGVENATELRLDPPVEKVWPAISHCFDLIPVKPVTYTLTALRGTEQVSQSITVQPGPPAVKLVDVLGQLDPGFSWPTRDGLLPRQQRRERGHPPG